VFVRQHPAALLCHTPESSQMKAWQLWFVLK
jgi:hypothetical protein